VNYVLRPHWNYGRITFHLVGNYLNELKLIGTPGAEPTNYRGTYELPAPKYQANFDVSWNYEKLTLAYNFNWFSHTLRYPRDEVNADPNLTAPQYKYYKAHSQHDIYASYDVTREMQLYAGINNLTDTKPDFAQVAYPNQALGRFFFVGAKVKLSSLF